MKLFIIPSRSSRTRAFCDLRQDPVCLHDIRQSQAGLVRCLRDVHSRHGAVTLTRRRIRWRSTLGGERLYWLPRCRRCAPAPQNVLKPRNGDRFRDDAQGPRKCVRSNGRRDRPSDITRNGPILARATRQFRSRVLLHDGLGKVLIGAGGNERLRMCTGAFDIEFVVDFFSDKFYN